MWLMVPWIACTSLSIITAGIFSTFFFILLFYLSFGGAEIVAMLIVFGLIGNIELRGEYLLKSYNLFNLFYIFSSSVFLLRDNCNKPY